MQTGWARQVGFLLESLSCILPAQQLFPIHFTPFLIPPNSLPGQGKRDPKPPPGEPCPELVSPFCSIHSPFPSLSACFQLPPWLQNAGGTLGWVILVSSPSLNDSMISHSRLQVGTACSWPAAGRDDLWVRKVNRLISKADKIRISSFFYYMQNGRFCLVFN